MRAGSGRLAHHTQHHAPPVRKNRDSSAIQTYAYSCVNC